MTKTTALVGLIFLLSNFLLADVRHKQVRDLGYEYISPLPNSRYVPPVSKILLRFKNGSPQLLHNVNSMIRVEGSQSKIHTGRIKIASDYRTLIFSPDEFFTPGETVTVSLSPVFTNGNTVSDFTYSFHVSDSQFDKPVIFPDDQKAEENPQSKSITKRTHGSARLKAGQAGQARIMSNGVSVPANFPEIDITINQNPDDGLIFINDRNYPCFQLILEHSGDPVWYWRVPDDRRDFKVQSNGQLSMMIRDGYGGNGDGYIVLDEQYEYVKTIRGSNGYRIDEHELLMLPDSGYFIIGRRDNRKT
jgi:hypothetical protein